MIEKVQNKRRNQKSEWNNSQFKFFIDGSHGAITSVYQVTVTPVLEKTHLEIHY